MVWRQKKRRNGSPQYETYRETRWRFCYGVGLYERVWGWRTSVYRWKYGSVSVIHILKKNLHRSAEKMGLAGNFIFQQDNDSKHTAKFEAVDSVQHT